MKKHVAGVDIGGTKIAAGIVDDRGSVLEKVVLPTRADEGFDVSLSQVYTSIAEVIELSGLGADRINGIGVCAPGPLDPESGIVHNPPNLKGWKDVDLVGLLKKRFRKETRLENDANAAGMAETKWGAARGSDDVFYVTVSTGIGTGIIIDGQIYHGKNGMAGEGGHVTIDYDSRVVCNCGNIGCVEALASGPGTVKRIVRTLKKNPGMETAISDMVDGVLDDITMVTVAEAAREGDDLAREAIQQQARYVGIWLGSMISVLDPGMIVIGGGVSLIGDLFFDEVKKTIPSRTINIYADKTPVVQAALKRDVGLLGAASIMM
ncbi:MAG: ROK family protein [Candidatus Omnitrophica bacterium]|nr:ROK family protein [Candidatus Omnitrophota bacterium]